MASEVNISGEAHEAADVALLKARLCGKSLSDAAVRAAAPHIDRAARIDLLKKLAAELDAEIKREYTEVLPGGPTVTREGWALYLHHRDLLEKIAGLEGRRDA